ncbi:Holliday junction resolvase [Escherichia coli]|uniref:Holliday junction resolvase n=1 Tax=Escherichia coli TaxID=562 RepID=A0A376P7E1_ECOLX|nr:Holliday junction resolvase [Escherichia coli]
MESINDRTHRICFALPANGEHLLATVSKAGERYRRDVALIVRQQRLKLNLSGRLAIKIIAEPPDKRRRDLDNILKAPLDALTHAGLLIDDEQFDEINIVRGQLVPGGGWG